MAEGLVFNAIEKLLGKIGSMAVEAWNVGDDVEKLVDNMSEIKAVILDAEEQQQQGSNSSSHQVQLWLEKLKDALDDADDFLDDFLTYQLRREAMTKHKKAKKVRVFFSCSNQLVFSFKMAHKIKNLGKRMEDLNVDRKIFNFTTRAPEQRVMKHRETHSFIPDEEVIGREEEKMNMLELLLDTNVKENVSVISIIGIGGLGKTAFAQLVYNDKAIQEHFEFKKWVCVADDSDVSGFDVKGIAVRILESDPSHDMESVQLELRKKVKGSRYLLVLDDVWNEDHDQWLRLMTLLKGGAMGSKIILTTRSEKVAKISGTSTLFFLKSLDEKQSWRLFSQLAFENGKEPENQILVSIGKEIVDKCSGIPLAIRSIGSLMYSMESEKDWSNFKDKDLIKIDEQGGSKVFQLLKLSYDHLPYHLKKCFAFCSLFPKDYYIERTMLIRLWVAQGFVQPSLESCLEDTGDKYFMTLVHRSFFQDSVRNMHGYPYAFKMHDLAHDLTRYISKNEFVMVYEKRQHIDKRTRHVSLGFKLDSSWEVPSSLLDAYKLRTFLLPHHSNANVVYPEPSLGESACYSIVKSFKQLRVLNLNDGNSRKIPTSIGMLNHLRYLDLCHSKQIEALPGSITKLINLETLLLNDCSMLRELPKDLWKLKNLRHLEFSFCDSLTFLPRGIGQLKNLQTLTRFMFDTTSKHSAEANELGELNNLRKGLEIAGLECLRHRPIEANNVKLMSKSHIQVLRLTWSAVIDDDEKEMDKDDMILQGLVLHPNIKDLQISGFGGTTISNLINLSSNLEELTLYHCPRLQNVPQLNVRHLTMNSMPCLEWIVNDSINESSLAFSASLTDISLGSLANLKGWCRCSEEEIQRGCCHQFNNILDNLKISTCPNLASIPQNMGITNIYLFNVSEKILQQTLNHSKVEILYITLMNDLKSISGVFQHLTRVSTLDFANCEEFDPCSDEDGSCYSMQWKELKNLKYLGFYGIPKMKYLPEGIQYITTLMRLSILDCVNLTFIPDWVTSLEELNIAYCPNLTSLPEGVEVSNY